MVNVCEHFEELSTWLMEHSMNVGGCGECGTPWIYCYQCDIKFELCGSSPIDVAFGTDFGLPAATEVVRI